MNPSTMGVAHFGQGAVSHSVLGVAVPAAVFIRLIRNPNLLIACSLRKDTGSSHFGFGFGRFSFKYYKLLERDDLVLKRCHTIR
jgi:hypothetical protein